MGNRVAWERKHLRADMGATEAIVVSFSTTPFWSLTLEILMTGTYAFL